MKTRKKPYTAAEVFTIVDGLLKAKGLIPAIADYGLAGSSEEDGKDIRTYHWDAVSVVKYGGSEGIYLDIYLEGDLGNDTKGEKHECDG